MSSSIAASRSGTVISCRASELVPHLLMLALEHLAPAQQIDRPENAWPWP